MKKIFFALTVAFALLSFNAIDNQKSFKKLYALEGLWRMNGKRGPVFEEWKKFNKNELQGRSYFLKAGDTIINERVTLSKTKAGIFYTPVVEDQNNKQPIAFKMTKAENNAFVFENPEHDFPKRIVYKLITSDSLHAFIDDGTENGKRQNFYFKRQ